MSKRRNPTTLTAPKQKKSKVADSSSSKGPSGWTCPVCAFDNEPSASDRCQMCSALRNPLAVRVLAFVAPLVSTGQAQRSIEVAMLDGKRLKVVVPERGSTVLRVKQLISQQDGLSIELQKLVADGRELDNWSPVSDATASAWHMTLDMGRRGPGIGDFHWGLHAVTCGPGQRTMYQVPFLGIHGPLVAHEPLICLAWTWIDGQPEAQALLETTIHGKNFYLLDDTGRKVEATCHTGQAACPGYMCTRLSFAQPLTRGRRHHLLFNTWIQEEHRDAIEHMTLVKRSRFTLPAALAVLPRDLAQLVAGYDSWTRGDDGVRAGTPVCQSDLGSPMRAHGGGQRETQVTSGTMLTLLIR